MRIASGHLPRSFLVSRLVPLIERSHRTRTIKDVEWRALAEPVEANAHGVPGDAQESSILNNAVKERSYESIETPDHRRCWGIV